MNRLTESQTVNIENLNVGGKGGKDRQLAEALGHDRAHAEFHDATQGSQLFEYKKQSGCQWIDAFKLARLDEAPEGIAILWFNHKNGVIQSVYSSTYEQVRDILFPTAIDRALLNMYKAIYRSRTRKAADQVKCKIDVKEIKENFTLLWERS
jgi:hypothetical protein